MGYLKHRDAVLCLWTVCSGQLPRHQVGSCLLIKLQPHHVARSRREGVLWVCCDWVQGAGGCLGYILPRQDTQSALLGWGLVGRCWQERRRFASGMRTQGCMYAVLFDVSEQRFAFCIGSRCSGR